MDRISTRRRTQLLLLAAAGLAVMSMTGLGMSLALFTDQTTVPANTFTTGTLGITTNHPSTAVVTLLGMAPGDQVTNSLLVSNTGTLALRYAITSTATNDGKGLKDQLVLTVKSNVATCTTAGFAGSGTQLYQGDLDNFPNGAPIVGDPATGNDPGDRPLAGFGSETLCFNVRLPGNTPSAFQGATTTATFTFDAEQTVNN